MDKFDLQIAMLRPRKGPAQLEETQFMKKLVQAQRAKLMRRTLTGIMGLAALMIIVGALRRNILDVLILTIRYFGELPHIFTEYSHAYTATISWPSVISALCLIALGVLLVRSRKDLTGAHSRRTYQYAAAMAVLALGLGVTGLLGGSGQAHADQDILKRTLNARGHLEVQVDDAGYELYGKSGATDDSIRNQALIEGIRNFDISNAYPNYQDMAHDGIVAEIQSVNPKDGCIYYVERRLEPTLNKVIDADSGCIRSSDPIHYLNEDLQPTGAPKWKVGQAIYLSHAHAKGTSQNADNGYVEIAVLLDGRADRYVAPSNNEKLVPKGQPGTGTESCGIDNQDLCPQTSSIDVFTNATGTMASGENGSSVLDDSLQPQAGSTMTEFFAKITAVDSKSLQLVTDSGKKITINWSQNIIGEFNAQGAHNYQLADGPLQVLPGDHLFVRVAYKDGMNLGNLSLSDVYGMSLALKPSLPDPLSGQTYSKQQATQQIEKF